MINPLCDKCGNELNEFGAILLSPPDSNDEHLKSHICVSCYGVMLPKFNVGVGYAVMLSPPDKNNKVKFSSVSTELYKSIFKN
jgi:hypothetical protein